MAVVSVLGSLDRLGSKTGSRQNIAGAAAEEVSRTVKHCRAQGEREEGETERERK